MKPDYLGAKSQIAGTLLSLRARLGNQPGGRGWLADETWEDRLQTLGKGEKFAVQTGTVWNYEMRYWFSFSSEDAGTFSRVSPADKKPTKTQRTALNFDDVPVLSWNFQQLN